MAGKEDHVSPIIEGKIELQGVTYPIMKVQPLAHAFQWNDEYLAAELRMFCLNDVGNGKSLHLTIKLFAAGLIFNSAAIGADQEKNYDLGTSYALCAPEIVLRAGYDSKIDIWAVGCMVSDAYF